MTEKKRGAEEHPVVNEIARGDEYFTDGKVDEGIVVYKSIARKLLKNGSEKEARHIYMRGGDILRQLGRLDDAAKMYESAGAYAKAAELYEQAALTSDEENARIKYGRKAAEVYDHLRKRSILIAEGKIRAKKSQLESRVEEGAGVAAVVFMIMGALIVVSSLFGQTTGLVVAQKFSEINLFGAIIFCLGIVSLAVVLRMRVKKLTKYSRL